VGSIPTASTILLRSNPSLVFRRAPGRVLYRQRTITEQAGG